MGMLSNVFTKLKGAFTMGKALNKLAPKPTAPKTQTIEWANNSYLAWQWWAQNKMLTPPKYDMSKAMGMIKPDPKYNAQVGTWAVAPMPGIKIPNIGYRLPIQAWAEAKIPAPKKSWWGTGGAWAPAAIPQAPAAPNIQQDVAWLLSKAGYISNYKPKRDQLANLSKEEKERYLRMYGPFKSIE